MAPQSKRSKLASVASAGGGWRAARAVGMGALAGVAVAPTVRAGAVPGHPFPVPAGEAGFQGLAVAPLAVAPRQGIRPPVSPPGNANPKLPARSSDRRRN